MNDWKNPSHYKKKDWEAIDIIKSVLTPEQFTGYLVGNSLKYLLRVNDKDTPLMNVGKAEWYSALAEKKLTEKNKKKYCTTPNSSVLDRANILDYAPWGRTRQSPNILDKATTYSTK